MMMIMAMSGHQGGKRRIMRNLLAPERYVRAFRNISPAKLKAQGIRLLMCDVDNTLVTIHHTECPPDLAAFADSLKREGIEIVLVSNNTRAHVDRVLKNRPDLPIRTFCCKPFPFALQKILRDYKITPDQAAIAGDQLFTDILGGNLLGMHTILCQPLSDQERKDTQFVRKAEELVYRRLEKEGKLKRGVFDD